MNFLYGIYFLIVIPLSQVLHIKPKQENNYMVCILFSKRKALILCWLVINNGAMDSQCRIKRFSYVSTSQNIVQLIRFLMVEPTHLDLASNSANVFAFTINYFSMEGDIPLTKCIHVVALSIFKIHESNFSKASQGQDIFACVYRG